VLGLFGLGRKDFIEGIFKIIEASARNDNRIASALCFFCNAEEATTVVLAELDREVFTFDLQFA